MKDLTLSDLIALREHCYQESLGFKAADSENVMAGKEYATWYNRFKLCDKELNERVEKIFEVNVSY